MHRTPMHVGLRTRGPHAGSEPIPWEWDPTPGIAHPQAINPIASTASARPARFHFVVASPKANTPTSAPSTTTPMFIPANTVAGLSGID